MVLIATSIEADETITITDSLQSSFQMKVYPTELGDKIVYGLLVREEPLPEDYRVAWDGIEVKMFD